MSRLPQVSEGVVTLSDGAALRYRLSAVGGRRRLVLIHPLAMNIEFWDPLVARLAEHMDILLYDVRGHGRSSPILHTFSDADHARDLVGLLDHLGWSGATVAGASMGGCIALAFAVHFPERAEGLGLIDTTSHYDHDPAAWERRGQRAMTEGFGAMIGFQLDRWFSDEFRNGGSPVIARAIEIFVANHAPSYVEACRMLGAFDMSRRLDELNLPARVIVGEHDPATPIRMARFMADHIPGAELRIVASTRHFTPLEAPDVVGDELRSLTAATMVGTR
ncbi:MAG TPA: alpha/beta fold hydrolase [Devosiaceae bacterium]|jgi:3-oxoadipate enol-lactonase